MGEIPCPTCSASTDPASDRCAACGASLVVCGRFRLRALLGRGGMGVVYEATDEGSADRARVAVKTLSLGGAVDWKTRDLFERSTRVLQGLDHPALPKVLAFEQDEKGRFVLVREAFDGGTLRERIAKDERRLTPLEVRALLRSLLELLAYLHGKVPPIIHRDIKPANIMFRTREDDRPVLVDFDTVAAPAGLRSGMTVVGTPGYTAPEQFAGDVSPASDLYALGATMLFVVTHVEADALPRKEGRFDVDAELAPLDPATRHVLARLVEVERSRRYARAEEALADLDGASREASRERDERAIATPAPALRTGTIVAIVSAAVVALFVSGFARSFARPKHGDATAIAPPSEPPPPPSAVTPVAPVAPAEPIVVATADPVPAPPAPRDPSSLACKGVTACYQQHGVSGQVGGKLVVSIAADGRAKGASYSGSAPASVRACLVALGKSKTVDDWDGPSGKLVCEYSGQVFKGGEMMMQDSDFLPDAPRAKAR